MADTTERSPTAEATSDNDAAEAKADKASKSKADKKSDKKDRDKAKLKLDKSDKKAKVSFNATMQREEAVAYLEAIVGGLRAGRMQFRQGEEHLVLEVGENVEVEVKATRKGDKGKVTFELGWRGDGPALAIVPD